MNKTDEELISALKSFSGLTQVLAAINLAKIDRFDIINKANITGLNEILQTTPEFQEIVAKKTAKTDLKEWSGEAAARNLWENDEVLKKEYGGDYESFLAYSKAADMGRV